MLYICYIYDIYIKVLYEKYGLRISMQHQALDHNCILDWPQCPRLGAFQRHVDVSSETGTPCNSSLGRPSSDHLKEMLKKNGQPLCCCHISCILKASSSNPTQSTPYHLLSSLSSTSFMSTFQPTIWTAANSFFHNSGLCQVYAPKVLVQLLGLLLANSAFINQKLHHVDTSCAICFPLHCLTPPFLP